MILVADHCPATFNFDLHLKDMIIILAIVIIIMVMIFIIKLNFFNFIVLIA